MLSKRKDFTQVALDVVRRATGEVTAPAPSKKPESERKTASVPIKTSRSGRSKAAPSSDPSSA